MATLLDTNVLLWCLTADPKLSNKVKEIVDSKSELVFSIVSLWEISVKLNIGKLQLTCSFDALAAQLVYIKANTLTISIEDTKTYTKLPIMLEHRDPFDRMLIAQAINNTLVIASADSKFDAYSVQRI